MPRLAFHLLTVGAVARLYAILAGDVPSCADGDHDGRRRAAAGVRSVADGKGAGSAGVKKAARRRLVELPRNPSSVAGLMRRINQRPHPLPTTIAGHLRPLAWANPHVVAGSADSSDHSWRPVDSATSRMVPVSPGGRVRASARSVSSTDASGSSRAIAEMRTCPIARRVFVGETQSPA